MSFRAAYRPFAHDNNSHSYLKLPLVPVEQFLQEFPDHADDDENALMVARIAHERAQRETLEQQRLELAKRKQKLIAENKRRKDDLANLDKDLEKFIDVRPLLLPRCSSRGNLLILYLSGRQAHRGSLRKVRLKRGHSNSIETGATRHADLKDGDACGRRCALPLYSAETHA